MSERDLGLKAIMRRLMWRMGFSTRVDVPLRAYVPQVGKRSRGGHESYTDLDVLGVAIAPGFQVHSVIADCKTTGPRSIERMFWLRGVADFFDADAAYMVRSVDPARAARQLSGRLNISVLTTRDIEQLEAYHPSQLPVDDGPLAQLFDRDSLARFLSAFTGLDKSLAPLLEYRQFDYWVYEPYRNLGQMVAHLQQAVRQLDPEHPLHRAVFFDCAWLYTLSLARAVAHVRAVHVTDVDRALAEYLFGGQVGLREKQQLAATLREVIPYDDAKTGDQLLPPYYRPLLELVTRFLRRPNAIPEALRYAEWLAGSLSSRRPIAVSQVFGIHADELAAKLLADVCGFLVSAAGLHPGFRTWARHLLVGEALPQKETVVPSRRVEAAPPSTEEPNEKGEQVAFLTPSEEGEGSKQVADDENRRE